MIPKYNSLLSLEKKKCLLGNETKECDVEQLMKRFISQIRTQFTQFDD